MNNYHIVREGNGLICRVSYRVTSPNTSLLSLITTVETKICGCGGKLSRVKSTPNLDVVMLIIDTPIRVPEEAPLVASCLNSALNT